MEAYTQIVIMAQKRMFDRSITDTELFMDMPMSSKALYFLLGMEADDEGFASVRKVMRVHGGTEDDLNILLAKGFVIRFKSGVVVITHWKKNNWLDSRRIRKTEYVEEKKLLITVDGNYVLSNGLARVEESRVEENRKPNGGEENAGDSEIGERLRIAAKITKSKEVLRSKKII
mgnify:CR=1 FL=1